MLIKIVQSIMQTILYHTCKIELLTQSVIKLKGF